MSLYFMTITQNVPVASRNAEIQKSEVAVEKDARSFFSMSNSGRYVQLVYRLKLTIPLPSNFLYYTRIILHIEDST